MAYIPKIRGLVPSIQIGSYSTGVLSQPSARQRINTGDRGLFGGGLNGGGQVNIIEYVNFSNLGNAIDFGDLTSSRTRVGGVASSTRGVFAGGGVFNASLYDTMDYITISSTGNATSFGSLTQARWGMGTGGSDTRGVFGGGYPNIGSGGSSNVIDYITIATTGNATDFGDLTVQGHMISGCTSPTRVVFGFRDSNGSENNTLDYITIASTGNATDFGDSLGGSSSAGASSNTRGFFASSDVYFIHIATLGNAVSFADLSVSTNIKGATSNQIVGIVGGGASYTNVMESFLIANSGASTDFGDLTSGREGLYGISNCHGGLEL